MREFYQRNPEKIKQRTAGYFEKNREAQNFRRQLHYLENVEHHSAISKKWANENPDKVRAMKASNRAKRRKAICYEVSSKDIRKILSKPCFYCQTTQSQHIDHILPLVRGGNHSVGNIIGACAKCNMTKNAKTIMEWRLYKVRTN